MVKKNFDSSDEVRSSDKAKVSVCDLGGVAAAKMVLQPGWSWESCVKPMVGAIVVRPDMWEQLFLVVWEQSIMIALSRFSKLATYILLNLDIMDGLLVMKSASLLNLIQLLHRRMLSQIRHQ